ncbi:MAG: DUF2282 domain-containing protein [Pseudomonadota bacterium]|nr:DUF2282 domain-containing protein [Pseudomonadota bacterium]
MDVNKIVKSAIANCLLISTMGALITTNTAIAAEKMEKCYGVTKAGMNDCKTATASCAGSATQDKQGDAFIFLAKGVCEKLVDGSLTTKKRGKR